MVDVYNGIMQYRNNKLHGYTEIRINLQIAQKETQAKYNLQHTNFYIKNMDTQNSTACFSKIDAQLKV